MDFVGIVGNAAKQPVRDGLPVTTRIGRTGEQICGYVHGEFFEAVSRGNVYMACTSSAGVAPGTALGTTGAFALHNPLGSGKNLVVLTASLIVVSGTLGAGSVFLTTHAGVAVANPTGTVIPITNALLGGQSQPVALAWTTATVATQILLRPHCSFGALVAASSALTPCNTKDQVNGEYVVPPGFSIGLNGVTAAGTSPLVMFGMTWEEVPV